MSLIFSKFVPNDDIFSQTSREITYGLWTNGTGTLTTFFTSSQQSSSALSRYYWTAYDANPVTTTTAEAQFDVTYANITGGGCPSISSDNTSKLPTKAVYGQLKNLLLGPSSNYFSIGGRSVGQAYAIIIKRERFKEKIDADNWQLTLKNLVGANRKTVDLIDDSSVSAGSSGDYGEVYNIVSGTIDVGTGATTIYNSSAPHYYGLFYPNMGIMVIDPVYVDTYLGTSTSEATTTYAFNHTKLWNAIKSGSYFTGRGVETVKSTQYICRAKASEFNFSNNPTFFTASDGSFVNTSFYLDPKTYITTIGLYDDDNELLAVGKLSQPIQKSYDKDLTFKVKLDF